MKKFAADRLMTVVLAPVVSEKSTFVADKNRQYVFRVADHATKPEIKAAVELMFKVEVKSVSVANMRGKAKRFGQLLVRVTHFEAPDDGVPVARAQRRESPFVALGDFAADR